MRPFLQNFEQQPQKGSSETEINVQEKFSLKVAMKAAPAARFMRSRDFLTTYTIHEN